jgi:hypothetical protein
MSPRRIPDPLLERYLAGALEGEPRVRLEALLAESAPDRARLEELRADSAAFLIQHGPGPLVARYEAERPRPAWWRRWPVLLAPALAAAAVALLVLRPDILTAKGPVELVLDYQRNLRPTLRALPLRIDLSFRVRAKRDGYVAVLGRGSRGTVTVLHPSGGTEAAPLSAASPLLSTTIELVEVESLPLVEPSIQEVYALYAERPFPLETIVRALEAGQPLDRAVPPGVSVDSRRLPREFTHEKSPGRRRE